MRANKRKPEQKRQPAKAKTPPQKPGREAAAKLATVITIGQVTRLPRKRSPDDSYDETVASEILAQLSEGTTMRAICKAEGMPSPRTVSRWVDADINGFAARYDRARRMQGDAIFDEVIDITNEEFVDLVEVQAAKLKVDARKWFLAKLNPKRYGDRVEILNRTEEMPDESLDAQLHSLLEDAGHSVALLKQPGARKLLAKPRS
ncbi:MAG: helix-turn-helix domain-containing protein [Rhodomicrobium sp.]